MSTLYFRDQPYGKNEQNDTNDQAWCKVLAKTSKKIDSSHFGRGTRAQRARNGVHSRSPICRGIGKARYFIDLSFINY